MENVTVSNLATGGLPARASEAAGRPTDEAQRASVRALAQQFESMLLAQMLRDMRRADEDDEGMRGLGNATMSDVMYGEVAGAMSRAGGIGLTDVIVNAFARADAAAAIPAAAVATPQNVPSSGTAHPIPVALAHVQAQATASGVTLPDAPVTSEFGWRADPVTGRQRFHAGTDLQMAYGKDVQVAAGGTITAVDDGSGYGLMVTVGHGGGLETRYAHLSSAEVRVGDAVTAGQTIARSGNSGRSTGPHLHFEVREHGKALDPDQFSERLIAATDDAAR